MYLDKRGNTSHTTTWQEGKQACRAYAAADSDWPPAVITILHGPRCVYTGENSERVFAPRLKKTTVEPNHLQAACARRAEKRRHATDNRGTEARPALPAH